MKIKPQGSQKGLKYKPIIKVYYIDLIIEK